MQINIQEVVSTVRAVDGDAALSPDALARIVEAVMKMVEARERHAQVLRAETRVSAGVAREQSEDVVQ